LLKIEEKRGNICSMKDSIRTIGNIFPPGFVSNSIAQKLGNFAIFAKV